MSPAPAILDEMARALAAGDAEPLDRYLMGQKMEKPLYIWDPTPADLPEPRLVTLLGYWSGLRGSGGFPPLDAVDPTRLGDALGYAMLLEALPDGDFRYRLYGSRIAERAGFDMTGKRTSEFPSGAGTRVLLAVVYRAAAARRMPIFTRHTPPPLINVARWSRLVLPMRGAEGRIDFLVGNVPGDRRT
jgi:hypothetical protein